MSPRLTDGESSLSPVTDAPTDQVSQDVQTDPANRELAVQAEIVRLVNLTVDKADVRLGAIIAEMREQAYEIMRAENNQGSMERLRNLKNLGEGITAEASSVVDGIIQAAWAGLKSTDPQVLKGAFELAIRSGS